MVVFYILLNKVHFSKCILLFVERVNHPFLCHPTDYGSKRKVNSMDVVPHICAKVCCLCPIKKRNGQIPFFIFEGELQNDKCGKTYYDEGQKRRHYICSNDILRKCFALCVRKYFFFPLFYFFVLLLYCAFTFFECVILRLDFLLHCFSGSSILRNICLEAFNPIFFLS